MLRDYGIDIETYLPIALAGDVVKHIDQAWEGKYTFEQLYKHDQAAAGRCLLAQFGHGVSATDEPKIEALFDELGIDEPDGMFDTPDVYDCLIALQQAIVNVRG